MFIQVFFNSVVSALLLSLVAIGFNLIFNATKVFHIAHGAIYVTAIYVFSRVSHLLETVIPSNVSSVVAIVASLVIGCFLILGIEYLVYRPLNNTNVNSNVSLISSIGVYLLIVNLLTFLFGTEPVSIHKDYKIIFSSSYLNVTETELMDCIVGCCFLGFVLLFSRSKLYTSIRAVTYDYSVAEKFGINISKARITALIAGTILASIAAIMKVYDVSVEPNAGLTVVLSASAAVIIGGINSLMGTVIACLIIALVENYCATVLPQWKDLFMFLILLIVLTFYQRGLIAVKQRIEIK